MFLYNFFRGFPLFFKNIFPHPSPKQPSFQDAIQAAYRIVASI